MASNEKRENGSAMDDTEFEKLLDEMDELGRQADALREKVNHLIDEMRENDVVEDGGDETGGAEDRDADHEAGEQAVDQGANDSAMDADHETSEEAVNEETDSEST